MLIGNISKTSIDFELKKVLVQISFFFVKDTNRAQFSLCYSLGRRIQRFVDVNLLCLFWIFILIQT